MRDGFQIRVEDAAFCVEGFAVAVAVGGGVEAVRQFVLGFWGETMLIFEENDLMLVKC